jgi:hypothetical protein
MSNTNHVITVAGREFVASTASEQKLLTYIKAIKHRYRLDRNAQTELTSALRDVLLDLLGNEEGVVTNSIAQKAIYMIGDTYDGEKGYTKVARSLSARPKQIVTSIKSWATKPQRKKRLLYILAIISLLPIVLAGLSMRASDKYIDFPPTTFSTTIGSVTLSNWSKSAIAVSQTPTTDGPDSTIYIFTACFVVLSVMFLFMARRSKYARLSIGN